MPQKAKISYFTFSGLINIILRSIPFFQPEPSLLYSKTAKDSASLAFYMNKIFGIFKIYQEQYSFLYNYFFRHNLV